MELFSTPVLFLVFNRIETTVLVFDKIKKIKPKYLFVASDGPRVGVVGEKDVVEKVRKFILDSVDWECEVKTLFNDNNLGCKIAVSSAINWFFNEVEEGIILEDDCLPNLSFFLYCEELLKKYRFDNRVMHISGNNFQNGVKRGDGSYYFSVFNHIWGWATWRRAWKFYDLSMSKYPEFEKNNLIKKNFNNIGERIYWKRIFKEMYENKINTWDYAWFFSCLINSGVTCAPNVNLVSNIGINNNPTHFSLRKDLSLSSQALQFPLVHPSDFNVNAIADEYTDRHFYKANFFRVILVIIVNFFGLKNFLKKIFKKLI